MGNVWSENRLNERQMSWATPIRIILNLRYLSIRAAEHSMGTDAKTHQVKVIFVLKGVL